MKTSLTHRVGLLRVLHIHIGQQVERYETQMCRKPILNIQQIVGLFKRVAFILLHLNCRVFPNPSFGLTFLKHEY